MPLYQDYYDLSSDDNDDDDSFSSSSSSSSKEEGNNDDKNDNSDELWGRSVLHIDVDCFYVQCEELDRGLREGDGDQLGRPLAIGQKHIVVTCNYAARARGVTKLMSKTSAMQVCPDLRIVDGSDLRRYRTHSRTIYKAFRGAIQEEIGASVHGKLADGCVEQLLPCKRNAMDEMVADLSTAVDKLVAVESEEGNAAMLATIALPEEKKSRKRSYHDSELPRQLPPVFKTYVFGDDSGSSAARIVEDQTGASTDIVFGGRDSQNNQGSASRSLAPSRRNVHEDCNNGQMNSERKLLGRHRRKALCRKRLEIAIRLAQCICQKIFHRTGFHVSAGISVSPMLAKLSVIEKPKTVNLLLPWRSPDLLYFMPLRKMHEMGSRTHRALSEVAFSAVPSKKSNGTANILVRNLLEIPREKIVESLLMMAQRGEDGNAKGSITAANNRSSCEQKCDLILQRCRGLDCTMVEDDGGGAPRTVSVENSFRRGTMTTAVDVQEALNELCRRLPPLVQDRAGWSRNPPLAYPTTLRLTVRTMLNIDDSERQPGPARRKPRHITRSKQASIGAQRGKTLLVSTLRSTPEAEIERSAAFRTLRDSVDPLVQDLLLLRDARIDVTRMNLAVTSFRDVATADLTSQSPYYETKKLSVNNNNAILDKQLNSKSCIETNGSPYEKRKNQNPTVASSMKPSKSLTPCRNPPSFAVPRTSAEQSKNSRKFARTRIDQFFTRK